MHDENTIFYFHFSKPKYPNLHSSKEEVESAEIQHMRQKQTKEETCYFYGTTYKSKFNEPRWWWMNFHKYDLLEYLISLNENNI